MCPIYLRRHEPLAPFEEAVQDLRMSKPPVIWATTVVLAEYAVWQWRSARSKWLISPSGQCAMSV